MLAILKLQFVCTPEWGFKFHFSFAAMNVSFIIGIYNTSVLKSGRFACRVQKCCRTKNINTIFIQLTTCCNLGRFFTIKNKLSQLNAVYSNVQTKSSTEFLFYHTVSFLKGSKSKISLNMVYFPNRSL